MGSLRFAHYGSSRHAWLPGICYVITSVIATKYLEKYNNKQIILLDDVFSELDIHRQEQLLGLLNSNKQIFITTTDINNISKEIIEKSNLIKIVKGE